MRGRPRSRFAALESGFLPEGATADEVEFRSGSVYQYFDVPEAVYQELLAAASVGGYLNENIKNSYRYAQI